MSKRIKTIRRKKGSFGYNFRYEGPAKIFENVMKILDEAAQDEENEEKKES